MFTRLVRSLIGRRPGQVIRSRSRQVSANLEALESRVLLDGVGPGNVAVTLAGGRLTITGDDYDNVIDVASDGTNLEVSGSGTTINGSTSAFTTPLVQITGDVKIQMRDGTDTVDITGWNVPKNLTIDMGEGDNRTAIADCTIAGLLSLAATAGDDSWRVSRVTIGKNVTIVSGEGDSTTEIEDTTFSGNVTIRNGFGYDSLDFKDAVVMGNMTVVNGDGGSDVTFERDNGTPRIHGNLSVTDLVGSDYVTLNNAQVDGKINADFGHGSGDQGLLLNNSTVGKDITLKSIDGMGLYDFNNAHVTGNVKISSQHEEGTALFRKGTTITGNVTLSGGVTPMGLRVTGATISGNLSLTNGAGTTWPVIDSSDASTSIGGKLTLQGGNGTTGLTIDDVDIAGAVKVSLGYGDDTINILNGVSFGGAVDLKVAGGRTNITIDAATFAGAVTINTGAGHDTVYIDDSTFEGVVKINTGAGNDQLNVDTGNAVDGITLFKKAVTVNLATGNDALRLGGGTASRIVRFSVASKIDLGGGIDSKYTWLDGVVVPTILSGEITVA